jgi:hypothetical protein
VCQRIRELLCRELLGGYMDAIFSSLLADVCDSQVCAAFGFYLPPMPDMFDRIMTGSSSPLCRSCPRGCCVGVWQESWPMVAAPSGDDDEEWLGGIPAQPRQRITRGAAATRCVHLHLSTWGA